MNPKAKMNLKSALSSRLDRLALLLIFLALSASTILWTIEDRTPPPWDPSDHIRTAYDYYRPLAHLDFGGFYKEVFSATHYYAPLVHLASASVFLTLSASRLSAIVVNIISLAV